MKRIADLVRPGGTLIAAALRHSHGYRVGGKIFPSANVGEDDLRRVLEPLFGRENVMIEVCQLAESESKGYSGVVLARAHGRRADNDAAKSGDASDSGLEG
jgi:hypothetical protein